MNLQKTGMVFLLAGLMLYACRRDDIQPDHFVKRERSAAIDSILDNALSMDIAVEKFVLPDGRNMKSFLLAVNPALDSILPRTGDHPFYDLQGDELKSLIISYMTMKAANAYQIIPNQYPGNGPDEPAQDKLAYVEGSLQTSLRSPGIGSGNACPRYFGLGEDMFVRYLMESAYLTLPQSFDPFNGMAYNDALGLTGLAHELEFETYEDVGHDFIRAGDVFVMFAANSNNNISWHSGLVMASSDDPDALMIADCYADVSQAACKTSLSPTTGPRLISLNQILQEIESSNVVEYKIIRLKKKFFQPYVSTPDPISGMNIVQYGSQIWMAEDLLVNGKELFSYAELGLTSGNPRGICPEGWHIPSLHEWQTMFHQFRASPYLWPDANGQQVLYYQGIGERMKSQMGWDPPGTNTYQFNVEPKGYIDVDGQTHEGQGIFMCYWTSTDINEDGASSIVFERNHHDVLADALDLKTLGYGCRCIKDIPGQSGVGCKYIPIVFHFLKCSADPTHEINNLDLSTLYDQIEYLNSLFRFSTYCVNFYLACENGQPVFEVHDICNGAFTGLDPMRYIHSDRTQQYTSDYLQAAIVPQIQSDTYEWHPDRYINVYISITNNGAIASFPATNPNGDAIIMPMEWMSGEHVSYDPGDPGRALTLGHEIGHYLGLKHPWSPVDYNDLNTNPALCSMINPGIADLVAFHGNVFQDSVMDCATNQMIYNNNLMSYGSFGVASVLSAGQISYMKAVLDSPASVHGRLELVRSSAICD